MKYQDNFKNYVSETVSEQSVLKQKKYLFFLLHNMQSENVTIFCNNYRQDEREKSIQKQYKPRDSLLTILMNITHIKSIHRIFIAILTVFFLNSVLIYLSETGG